MARKKQVEDTPASSRSALVIATIVYFTIHTFVPFGGTILYPLTLLATWVHEMGHGTTALVLGGHFSSLDVFANGSGLAYTDTNADWKRGLVAMGGLVAPPIVGAILLSVSRGPKRARVVLVTMTVAIIVSLILWVRSTAGWIALPLDAGALAIFAIWGGPRERMVFAQLIGIALAIDTWAGKGYLFAQSAMVRKDLPELSMIPQIKRRSVYLVVTGDLTLQASDGAAGTTETSCVRAPDRPVIDFNQHREEEDCFG